MEIKGDINNESMEGIDTADRYSKVYTSDVKDGIKLLFNHLIEETYYDALSSRGDVDDILNIIEGVHDNLDLQPYLDRMVKVKGVLGSVEQFDFEQRLLSNDVNKLASVYREKCFELSRIIKELRGMLDSALNTELASIAFTSQKLLNTSLPRIPTVTEDTINQHFCGKCEVVFVPRRSNQICCDVCLTSPDYAAWATRRSREKKKRIYLNEERQRQLGEEQQLKQQLEQQNDKPYVSPLSKKV